MSNTSLDNSSGVNTTTVSTWVRYESGDAEALLTSVLIILVLIIICNVVNLAVFSKMYNLEMQHYYMVALTVADLVTLVPYTVSIVVLCMGYIYLTESTCDLYGIITISPFETTVCIQTVMSIDKCRSIMNPIEYRLYTLSHNKAKIKTITVIVMCFMLPLLFNGLLLWGGIIDFYYEQNISTCYVAWDLSSTLALSIFTVCPLIIQLVTHGLIISKILALKKRNRRRILKASSTVLLTVGIFYICWLPHGIYVMWRTLTPNHPPPGMYMYASAQILSANGALSILIYYNTIPKYYNILAKILGTAKPRHITATSTTVEVLSMTA